MKLPQLLSPISVTPWQNAKMFILPCREGPAAGETSSSQWLMAATEAEGEGEGTSVAEGACGPPEEEEEAADEATSPPLAAAEGPK